MFVSNSLFKQQVTNIHCVYSFVPCFSQLTICLEIILYHFTEIILIHFVQLHSIPWVGDRTCHSAIVWWLVFYIVWSEEGLFKRVTVECRLKE